MDRELYDDVWAAADYVSDRQDGPVSPAAAMAFWIAADPERAADFMAWAEQGR